MPVTITVDENSYISLEDANEYFNGRLNSSEWEEATDTDKKKALITATKRIDYLNFIGRKESLGQSLKFPRVYSHSPNSFFPDSQSVVSGTKPDDLLDATCEEAIALLSQNLEVEKRQRDGIESEKIGDTSRSYNSNVVESKQQGRGLLSPEAKSLLRGYIKSTVRLG